MSVKALAISILSILLLVGVWLMRESWLSSIGYFLIYEYPLPLRPAQAILPLAGGRNRVVYAAQLYREGYAEWFLATDMPFNAPGVHQSYAELVRQEAIWQGVPESQILLSDEIVTSTYAEIRSVQQWAETRGFDSVLVVTSTYHTRRTALMLRDVFSDSDIRVQIASAADDEYQPESWWKTEAGARLTWTEYLKLGLYLVGYR